MSRVRTAAAALSVSLLVGACTTPGAARTGAERAGPTTPERSSTATTDTPQPTSATGVSASGSPGSSRPTTNVYANAAAGDLAPGARAARPMVYVPNTLSDTVQLIDPQTFKVVARYRTGREPQHVVPSWDLKTLSVNEDIGNELLPIDPRTGKAGKPVPVEDPYNLYFTPDGSRALVMAERLRRIDVRDAHTMKLERSLPVPCYGVNHADFSADLSYFVASCEFSGLLLVVDAGARKVEKVIDLNGIRTPGATSPKEAMRMKGSPKQGLRPGASAMPQDVRLTPDGRFFVVADMLRNGVWVIDARGRDVARFLPTGVGAHGLYPSRDAQRIFVSNRDAGTVTVLDAATLAAEATWRIPGGSPDMGGVSADGSQLWLSGRYDRAVYVIDTRTGELLHKIAVDAGPHGLCVWPQPGRFSLGHTGNMR